MWAVREIAENTLAIGYNGDSRFQVYVGEELTINWNVGMSFFGFILPDLKGSEPQETTNLP